MSPLARWGLAMLATILIGAAQAFLMARFNFRGPLHPLLLLVCPVVCAAVAPVSGLGRLGIFVGLAIASGVAFALTAETLGTFS